MMANNKTEFDYADPPNRGPSSTLPANRWQSQLDRQERVVVQEREVEINTLHDRLSRLAGTAPPVPNFLADDADDEENTALADIRNIARSYRELCSGDARETVSVAEGSSTELPTIGTILIPTLRPIDSPATEASRMQLRLLAVTSAVCAVVGATIVALTAVLA